MFRAIVVTAIGLTVSMGSAQAAPLSDIGKCESADLLGSKLISNICWNCIFPIVMSGIVLKGSNHQIAWDENGGTVEGSEPSGLLDRIKGLADLSGNQVGNHVIGTPANRGEISPFCSCGSPFDPTDEFYYGYSMSMWQPVKLIETTTRPGCSAVLNGTQLPGSRLTEWGVAEPEKDDDTLFEQVHLFEFPIAAMLNLVSASECMRTGLDMDMLYISELDPTWRDARLANKVHPEFKFTANSIAEAACAVDAIGANFGFPISSMFWCAGSWGSVSPIAGSVAPMDRLDATALLATRVLYKQHRNLLAYRTYKDDSMCRPIRSFTMPKSQYRLQLAHPRPLADKAIWVGQSSLSWGFNKKSPTSINNVYTLFQFSDCCNRMPTMPN